MQLTTPEYKKYSVLTKSVSLGLGVLGLFQLLPAADTVQSSVAPVEATQTNFTPVEKAQIGFTPRNIIDMQMKVKVLEEGVSYNSDPYVSQKKWEVMIEISPVYEDDQNPAVYRLFFSDKKDLFTSEGEIDVEKAANDLINSENFKRAIEILDSSYWILKDQMSRVGVAQEQENSLNPVLDIYVFSSDKSAGTVDIENYPTSTSGKVSDMVLNLEKRFFLEDVGKSEKSDVRWILVALHELTHKFFMKDLGKSLHYTPFIPQNDEFISSKDALLLSAPVSMQEYREIIYESMVEMNTIYLLLKHYADFGLSKDQLDYLRDSIEFFYSEVENSTSVSTSFFEKDKEKNPYGLAMLNWLFAKEMGLGWEEFLRQYNQRAFERVKDENYMADEKVIEEVLFSFFEERFPEEKNKFTTIDDVFLFLVAKNLAHKEERKPTDLADVETYLSSFLSQIRIKSLDDGDPIEIKYSDIMPNLSDFFETDEDETSKYELYQGPSKFLIFELPSQFNGKLLVSSSSSVDNVLTTMVISQDGSLIDVNRFLNKNKEYKFSDEEKPRFVIFMLPFSSSIKKDGYDKEPVVKVELINEE